MWPLQIKLNRVVGYSTQVEPNCPSLASRAAVRTQNHLPRCIVDRFRFLLTIGRRAALCRALIAV